MKLVWLLMQYIYTYISSSSFRQLGQVALAFGNLGNNGCAESKVEGRASQEHWQMLPHTLGSLWNHCGALGLMKLRQLCCACPRRPLPPSQVTTCHSQESAGVILKAVLLVAIMPTWTVFTHAIKMTRSHLQPVAIPRSSHWGHCRHRA